MSDSIIRVENLSKSYVLRHKVDGHARYTTLRDTITNSLSSLGNALRGRKAPKSAEEKFWAVKDVSFNVKQGDKIGVIGRNGAGKSTLLKLLSRITEPTSGCIRVRGRIASLLEVGTGFHPELTGRENIFLNGAILGMTKAEIKSKFDEIVAFAGVEKFLDTPVKRYSSGMYVRLAFAVAAHLEPEILIVDEVLAVGDAAFQKKCLGKMNEVSQQGRTIFLVSHNMGAITHLCQRGIIMEQGQLKFDGTAEEAVHNYNLHTIAASSENKESSPHIIFKRKEPSRKAYDILELSVFDLNGKPKCVISTGDSFAIRITYRSEKEVSRASVNLRFTGYDGSKVLYNEMDPDSGIPLSIKPGEHTVECVYTKFPLAAGEFIVAAGLNIPFEEHLFRITDLGRINVATNDVYKSGYPVDVEHSMIIADHYWKILS